MYANDLITPPSLDLALTSCFWHCGGSLTSPLTLQLRFHWCWHFLARLPFPKWLSDGVFSLCSSAELSGRGKKKKKKDSVSRSVIPIPAFECTTLEMLNVSLCRQKEMSSNNFSARINRALKLLSLKRIQINQPSSSLLKRRSLVWCHC